MRLTKIEWQKNTERLAIFLRKYKSLEEFTLFDNQKVHFEYTEEIYEKFKNGNINTIMSTNIMALNNTLYQLTDLKNTEEFGMSRHRPVVGAGTIKEDIQLQSLKSQIQSLKINLGSTSIPIRIKGKMYQVYDAISTPGTPKSDFHLIDVDGNELVWISHKDGSKPKDFRQWGGISARREPIVSKHVEVKSFVRDLKVLYPSGMPQSKTFYRHITSKKLKMISIYGSEYTSAGNSLSRQNCSILIQGPVELIRQSTHYIFKSNHIHFNGDNMTGGFVPVLAAIFVRDRSDAGLKGSRIVIMPKEGRKMSGII